MTIGNIATRKNQHLSQDCTMGTLEKKPTQTQDKAKEQRLNTQREPIGQHKVVPALFTQRDTIYAKSMHGNTR